MKGILGRLFIVFLIGLFLIKISAFHVYEDHDPSEDSSNHCELCLLSFVGQQSEGQITPPFITLQEPETPITTKQQNVFYASRYSNANKPVILFSRPPPYSPS